MWASKWAHVEIFLFVVIFLNYMKGLLFCVCEINMITSHQNPVFTQWEYSRHQIKAAMQLKLKFNIINLIIVHNHLTVLRIGFKGWYCNWLLIIKKHAGKITLPGWWWVTILSYPGPDCGNKWLLSPSMNHGRCKLKQRAALWTCGAQ